MLQRSDNVLIRFQDAHSVKSVSIEALSLSPPVIRNFTLSYDQLDEIFRFNPLLMNPAKRDERYKWIAQRVVLTDHSSDDLMLSQDPVAELIPVKSCEDVKLPFGRMSLTQRQKLRDELHMLEEKRDRSIDECISARNARFIAKLAESRQREVEDAARRNSELFALNECKRIEQAESTRRAEETKILRAALSAKRYGSIREIEASRQERATEYNQHVFASKLAAVQSRNQHSIDSKLERAERKKDEEKEQQDFFTAMSVVEAKREQAYLEREQRWEAKSVEYLLKRAEVLKQRARKQVILSEKRKDQAYRFFNRLVD